MDRWHNKLTPATAWVTCCSTKLAMNADFSGMTAAAYLASLPSLPQDFPLARCGSVLQVTS
jgi:hypothetical protein